MGRKAGTPNKPKLNVTKGELIIPVDKVEKEEPYYYIIVEGNRKYVEITIEFWLMRGYECQGGVSVTNYRANDGSIVFVYCQAMIRKE